MVKPQPETAPAAVSAIERVLWREGITGDACARVAAQILAAVAEAGFAVTPRRSQRR